MKNIFTFFQEKNIKFASEKQALRWIRRLRPKSLVKIGLSYFVDEQELSQLLEEDFKKKQKLRAERMQSGKKLSKKNSQKRRIKRVVPTKDSNQDKI